MNGAGRLTARPGAEPRDERGEGALCAAPPAVGDSVLGLGRGGRDGLLHVPPRAIAGEPCPLVVLLHGAGSSARRGLDLLASLADDRGLILLAPDSRAPTWDVIAGGLGPDVAFLDAALERACAALPVDPARVALGGFSDGASYALTLGLTNGDLFTHLIAFAPGFAAPPAYAGEPRVFVTHGTGDRVLPIDRCSRRLVPALEAGGYDVIYTEFDGNHEVPRALAAAAVDWLG